MMSKPNEKKVITALMRQQWPHVSQRPRNQDEERDTVRALSMALRFAAIQRTDMDDPTENGCGNLGRTHARVNQAGDARCDEKTSRMLADTSSLLMKRYHGDLRKRREAAERDPARERKLLVGVQRRRRSRRRHFSARSANHIDGASIIRRYCCAGAGRQT